MKEHNSSKTSEFELGVDEDGKATSLNLLSFSNPHMRTFHLSWLSLFSSFFSNFSVPPLLPILRRHLHLTPSDVSRAGVLSVTSIIIARLAMGPACDLLGPRLASAAASLISAPCFFLFSFPSSPLSFPLLRFISGISLANFVANQYWISSMFAPNVVGLANGVSAGWGGVGSGAAQVVMPLAFTIILFYTSDPAKSWRVAFLIPAIFQVLTALAVLAFGQDRHGAKNRSVAKGYISSRKQLKEILLEGLGNYRGWVLALTYGYCYGVELTMENIVAEYYYEKFGLDIETAGVVAACFGVANVVSRPAGGMISDEMGRRFGMRGRLWCLWITQSVAGLMCVVLGRMRTLGTAMTVMVVFALFLQGASGMTFGVVPFVSKRSLGVISGMTGSGGALGAAVTQLLFFSGSKYSKETGISLMGIMILFCTTPITLIYFPKWGGMFCGPSQVDDDLEGDYQLLK